MDFKQELRELRLQMATDFKFTALALKDVGQRFRAGMTEMAQATQALSRKMNAMGRDTDERLSQVEGRMRLQEQRFTLVLGAVEDSLFDWKPEIEEIKARLDRLEQKADPAA